MKRSIAIGMAICFATLGAPSLQGGEKLKAGDKAPHFHGKTADGDVFDSKKHIGKKTIVVFFFPAAFTGG